jgi:transcription initiation factor TFIIA large subunit
LDESESEEEEIETDNIILCQYEKVSRIKNKWKTVLKDGVIHVNGKDYLFNRSNGDFEW